MLYFSGDEPSGATDRLMLGAANDQARTIKHASARQVAAGMSLTPPQDARVVPVAVLYAAASAFVAGADHLDSVAATHAAQAARTRSRAFCHASTSRISRSASPRLIALTKLAHPHLSVMHFGS